MMEITYTVSEDDFVKAGMLMMRKRSPILRVLPWLMVVVILWVVVQMVTNPEMRAKAILDELPRTVGGLTLPVLIALLPLISRYALRKNYRKTPILSETRTLNLDDSGLDFRSKSAQGRVDWSAYVSYLEDKSNFLLVQQGKQIFVPIPKRELSEPQIGGLRDLFQAHLASK